MLELLINATARVIEAIAATMIAASVAFGVIDLLGAAICRRLTSLTTEVRLRLAERLVVSLEFLIAADILKTIVTPTLEGIGLVAGVIVIRTVLSLSIAYELRRASAPAHAACSGTTSGVKSPLAIAGRPGP